MCAKENKNNLKELMMSHNISNAELCSMLSVGESAVKSYLNGNRLLPLHHGLLLAEKYNVSLDWLYCRTNYTCEHDIMSSIALALYKVFCINENTKSGYPILYIDRLFCNYLEEINEIRLKKSLGGLDNSWYELQIEAVQSKYKDYFDSIFGLSGFNKDKAVEIAFSDDLRVIEYLSKAL